MGMKDRNMVASYICMGFGSVSLVVDLPGVDLPVPGVHLWKRWCLR